MRGGSPDHHPPDERPQRQMLVVLALLGVLTQAGTASFIAMEPGAGARGVSIAIGLVLSVALSVLASSPWLPLALMQKVSVGLVSGWFVLNLASVVTTHRPVTSGLLLHMVILGLLAFAWLPAKPAATGVLTAYLLLCGAAWFSNVPDMPGLIQTGFVILLTWYLTLYGHAVSAERSRSQVLAVQASSDPLTGLRNRRAGHEDLSRLARRWQHSPERLAVLLLDLDHFKQINDSMGHARGDEVLRMVAGLLGELTRPGDVVIRWGGEEFLVVLPGLSSADAREVGERVLGRLRTARMPGFPVLTMSGGLASLSETQDVMRLLELADARLYAAKARGRDCLVHDGPGRTIR